MLRRMLVAGTGLLSALILSATPLLAQITTGTVSGNVKDAQGGVIPGAIVVLISEARGTKSTPALTNETGNFVFPNVTPDTYAVEVTLEGFKTARRTGVAVSGGDRVGVQALTLEAGALAETVNVIAESPLVQTQSGERSIAITSTRALVAFTRALYRARMPNRSCVLVLGLLLVFAVAFNSSGDEKN